MTGKKRAIYRLLAVGIASALCMLLAGIDDGHADPCDPEDPAQCRIDIPVHHSVLKRTQKSITRISIADPDIADYHLVTPKQVLLVAKKEIGTTNMILWHGEADASVYELRVFVPGSLIEAIEERIDRLAPGARIQVHLAKDGVILDGEVESQEMLDRVLTVVKSFGIRPVNLLTVRGTQQIQLEVRIAEVSRSGMKKMGLGFLNNSEWSVGVFPAGNVSGTAAASVTSTPESVTETVDPITGAVSRITSTGADAKSLDSLLEIASPFASAFQVAVHSLSGDTLALLGILKGQGLARLLARPTLVTMSGQDAEFLVGGEFPVPIQGDQGQTNIEFRKFGIMLRFTPTVVGRETITLKVEPEVSSPDYSLAVFSGGVAVPGLKTRRGSTTLQLKDGQTFAMAGLLKEESRTAVNKIPFLGDIPVLGTLFTSKEYQKEETELVIVVTPRMVRAMNPEEVPPLPGEAMSDTVDDVDFFLLNRTDSGAGKAPSFQGDIGFSK